MRRINKVSLLRHFSASDIRIFSNSFWLIFSFFIQAIASFVFWKLILNSTSSATMGESVSLISATSMISIISLLGFDFVVIRYPKMRIKSIKIIFFSIIVTVVTTSLISLLFAVFFYHLYVPLLFLFISLAVSQSSLQILRSYMISVQRTIFFAISSLSASVFILIVPIVYKVNTSDKILLIYFLFQLISLLLNLLFITKREHQVKTVSLTEERWFFKEFFTYSAYNYLFKIVSNMYQKVAPIILTIIEKPELAAYLYIIMTINGMFGVVGNAFSDSFLTEIMKNNVSPLKVLFSTIKKIILTMSILVFAAIIFSPFILLFFGKDFLEYGAVAFVIMLISSIFKVVLLVLYGYLRFINKSSFVFVSQLLVSAISFCGFIFVKKLGLTSLALFILAGNVIVVIAISFLVYFFLHKSNIIRKDE